MVKLNGVLALMKTLLHFCVGLIGMIVLLLVITCGLMQLFFLGVTELGQKVWETQWVWVKSCTASPNRFLSKTYRNFMALVKKARKF